MFMSLYWFRYVLATRPADSPRRQMAIEDGIDLVGPLRRLVDALRIQRDHARRLGKHPEEGRDVRLRQTGCPRGRGDAAGDAARPRQRVFEARGVTFDIIPVEHAGTGEIHQQPAEQHGVGARLQSEKQIGIFGGVSPARVDDDHARAAALLVGDHALEQNRMAPRGIAADENGEIGRFDVLVAAWHDILTEGADMAGDRRCHASRELVSILALPINPFISLLAT